MNSSTDYFAPDITLGARDTTMVESKRQSSLLSWSLHSSVGRLIISHASILDSGKS